MKKQFTLLLLAATLLVVAACTQHQQSAPPPPNKITINGSVHDMELNPEPAPEFPEHEGKAEFISYCGICHSLKYITMQPNFSAKTWDAEVTKMIAKYHAPIDSVNAKKITAYLVAVKSTPATPPKS